MKSDYNVRQTTLEFTRSGNAEFYTPTASDETMLVQVPPHVRDDLFMHQNQTDQLLAVRGSFVLVILRDRHYEYIPLSDQIPTVMAIPPGVYHGALSFSDEPCIVVNAVIRHGEAMEADYEPIKPPVPYDLEAAQLAFDQLQSKAIAEAKIIAGV
ncbi:MAG: dTDP-4-dehydrorhamnose 3,5-epimerase [Cyanobacteria bacterium P01_C01_bin.89]